VEEMPSLQVWAMTEACLLFVCVLLPMCMGNVGLPCCEASDTCLSSATANFYHVLRAFYGQRTVPKMHDHCTASNASIFHMDTACRHVIEREIGCNHIKCRCGTHLCYKCGVAYVQKKAQCRCANPTIKVCFGWNIESSISLTYDS